MYSLNDAEYYCNAKTKEALHREDYMKLLRGETKGIDGYESIVAVERRLGFDFCYRDSKGVFTKPDGTILNGLEETNLKTLTPTEQHIANMAKQGLTNRQIAKELGIAEGTIRTHMSRILIKLKINSRKEL